MLKKLYPARTWAEGGATHARDTTFLAAQCQSGVAKAVSCIGQHCAESSIPPAREDDV